MDNYNRVYAPIIITTCNRYELFKACIESLKKNALAVETELFIGLDYPPSDQYEDGYHKVEDYLNKGIDGFKNINIIKRNYNFGALRNELDLIDLVSQKYDRWIFTEDDNIFSVDFLDYMNYYLELYKDNDKIFSVGAYTHPKEEKFFAGKENYIFAKPSCNAYGYGVWSDKWSEFANTISRGWFEDNVRKTYSLKMPRRIKYRFVGAFVEDRWEIADTTIGFYLWFSKKYQTLPRNTKVKNNGYDGSGVHAPDCKDRNEGVFKENERDFEAETADNRFCVVSKEYYSKLHCPPLSIKYEIIYYTIHLIGFNKARTLLKRLKMF